MICVGVAEWGERDVADLICVGVAELICAGVAELSSCGCGGVGERDVGDRGARDRWRRYAASFPSPPFTASALLGLGRSCRRPSRRLCRWW